jgi:hypothetical protein
VTKAGFQRGGAEMLHPAIMKPYRPEHEFFSGGGLRLLPWRALKMRSPRI